MSVWNGTRLLFVGMHMVTRMLGVFFLVAVALTAHGQATEFDRYAADIGLLQRTDVQEELTLTTEQITEISAKSHEYAARIEEKTARLQGDPEASVVEAVRREVAEIQQEFRGEILGLLQDNQIVRLRQLALQRAGELSMLDDKVAAEVGLPEEKRVELEETYRSVQGRIESAQSEAFDPIVDEFEARRPTDPDELNAWRREFEQAINEKAREIGPQLQAIAAEYGAAMQQTVTDENRAKLVELMGPRFEFRD